MTLTSLGISMTVNCYDFDNLQGKLQQSNAKRIQVRVQSSEVSSVGRLSS
jgi:hypothetical protein